MGGGGVVRIADIPHSKIGIAITVTHSGQTCSCPIAVGVTHDATAPVLKPLSHVHRGVNESDGSRTLVIGLLSILETIYTSLVLKTGLDRSYDLHLETLTQLFTSNEH